jgi:predicted DCC family thiol-disulfide oxidoreductase YuxK
MTAVHPGSGPAAGPDGGPAAGTVVYDGDCSFCTWSVTQGQRLLKAGVTAVPWQRADLAALGLDRAAVSQAVQWVAADHAPEAGHRAIAAWLIASGLPWSLAGRLMLIPPVSWLAAGMYHVVSRNRHRIPGPWRAGGVCRVSE